MPFLLYFRQHSLDMSLVQPRTAPGIVRSRDTGARPIIISENKIIRSVDIIYPTGIIADVSVELPDSVSNFLFLRFRIIGRGLLLTVHIGRKLYDTSMLRFVVVYVYVSNSYYLYPSAHCVLFVLWFMCTYRIAITVTRLHTVLFVSAQ
jgi:hypothetical protein